jgi:hypothetical protein
MKNVSVGIASDYAVLSFDGGRFYYGYEETQCTVCGYPCSNDDHEEYQVWCFKAVVNEAPRLYPFSELGMDDMFEVDLCLLAGIGKWMNEHD